MGADSGIKQGEVVEWADPRAELEDIKAEGLRGQETVAGALRRLSAFTAVEAKWGFGGLGYATVAGFLRAECPWLADLAIPADPRREIVALLAAEKATQKAIATALGVDQATVSRDFGIMHLHNSGQSSQASAPGKRGRGRPPGKKKAGTAETETADTETTGETGSTSTSTETGPTESTGTGTTDTGNTEPHVHVYEMTCRCGARVPEHHVLAVVGQREAELAHLREHAADLQAQLEALTATCGACTAPGAALAWASRPDGGRVSGRLCDSCLARLAAEHPERCYSRDEHLTQTVQADAESAYVPAGAWDSLS